MSARKIMVSAAVCFVVLLANCGKKSDPAPLTKTQLLSAQKWLPVQMKLKISVDNPFIDALLPDSLRNLDFLDALDSCQKDNPFQFKANKTYIVTDEALKCPEFEPLTGTWSLSPDDSKFSISSEQFVEGLPGASEGFLLDMKSIIKGLFTDMEVMELKAGSFKTRKTFSQKINDFRLPNFPLPISFNVVFELNIHMK